MKKLINSILFLLVSLATFGQNKEIQTKNLMGLYYVSLGEGWINKNGMEIIPGPDHYVFIELKSDSTFIRTIVQEISHINHYEIGKWKYDGDTIFLTTQHQKNTTKYILKSQSNDQYYFTEINTNYSYYKTKKEDWRYNEITKLTIFEGTALNVNGKAVFIPDFADSAIYYLEGLQKWDDKFLNKKLKIYGLFSEKDGVIKNWTIIE